MTLSDTRLRRWQIILMAQGVVLVAGLLFGGCGQVTQAESAGQATSRTATTTTSTDHNTAMNWCPSKQIPVDGGTFHPAVTATYTLDQGAAQPVAVAKGQGLEIHLAPDAQWSLIVTDTDRTLDSVAPAGWYDASLGACVWRFVASSVGVAWLTFKGLVLCQPNVHCKAALEEAVFAVTTH